MLILIVALIISSAVSCAGGDKNTLRGSEGEQIGEPSPNPAENPLQYRAGDPNPGMANVPEKFSKKKYHSFLSISI